MKLLFFIFIYLQSYSKVNLNTKCRKKIKNKIINNSKNQEKKSNQIVINLRMNKKNKMKMAINNILNKMIKIVNQVGHRRSSNQPSNPCPFVPKEEQG